MSPDIVSLKRTLSGDLISPKSHNIKYILVKNKTTTIQREVTLTFIMSKCRLNRETSIYFPQMHETRTKKRNSTPISN